MPYPTFLRPDEIMNLMDCCRSSAYGIIRDLNDELEKKNMYVRKGRVSTKYFCERFGIDPETIGAEQERRKKTG